MTDANEATTLYLTTLECKHGHRQTIAHEGPLRPLDQSAPTPDAAFCPKCSTDYDHDCDVVEVHEAERVEPERIVKDDLFEEALRQWGEAVQRDMAVEECAEAIVANQHRKRGRATREELIEEFADVKLLMEQMAVAYGPQFDEMYDHKLHRLEQRVTKAERAGTDEIAGDDDAI